MPEGAEVPLPPSVAALANPSDLETAPEEGSTEFTTTTAPAAEETTTTAAPATTTTAPG